MIHEFRDGKGLPHIIHDHPRCCVSVWHILLLWIWPKPPRSNFTLPVELAWYASTWRTTSCSIPDEVWHRLWSILILSDVVVSNHDWHILVSSHDNYLDMNGNGQFFQGTRWMETLSCIPTRCFTCNGCHYLPPPPSCGARVSCTWPFMKMDKWTSQSWIRASPWRNKRPKASGAAKNWLSSEIQQPTGRMKAKIYGFTETWSRHFRRTSV